MNAPLSAYLDVRHSFKLQEDRPFVCLSYAQSLDGSIALDRGTPYSISGEASMALTHHLRALNDAILVGIGTILADNPQLTVRFADGSDPQPIILDSRLRTPPQCKVVSGPKPPWIATRETLSSEKAKALVSRGVRLFSYANRPSDRIPLETLLFDLKQNGIKAVMVEGGAEVIHSFLLCGYVDWIMLTISPCFLGGLHALGYHDSNPQSRPIRLESLGWSQFQEDLVVWGQPTPVPQ